MNFGESIREREARKPHHASETFLDAKREVMLLARQGRLISPQDAWMLAGNSEGKETLWSVAYRIGTANEVSAEEICAFLEKQFPRYSKSGNRPQTSWDDIVRY